MIISRKSISATPVLMVLHSIALLTLALAYMLSNLLPYKVLEYATQVLAIIVLIESIPLSEGIPRKISLVLLVLGAFLSWYSKAGVFLWLRGFGQNVGLITIFILTPQLAVPLKLERYTTALADLYRAHVNSRKRLCFLSMFLTHFISVIFNIGSIPVVYNLVRGNIREDTERLVLTAISRGFATSIMWSPYFAAMALVLSQMDIPWFSILPVSFTLAMVSLCTGFLLDYRQWAGSNDVRRGFKISKSSQSVLLGLFASGLGVTIWMLAVEWLTGLNMILIVGLTAILFPLLWSLGAGHGPVYRQEIKKYFSGTLPLLRNEIVLFLSSGFFSSSVANSGAGKYLAAVVQMIAGHGQFLAQSAILFSTVLLALIGIHPIISVSILAASLHPPIAGFSAQTLAVTLLTSWAIANISSPFTATNMMLAGFTGRTSMEVGLRWNITYVVVAGLVVSCFLLLGQVFK